MANTQKLGPGKFRAKWVDPAGRHRSKSFTRKIDADRYGRDQEHRIDQGSYIDSNAARMTVGALAEQWIAGKVNLKPTTQARYRGVIDVQLLPHWGTVPLSRVQHGDIQAWVAGLIAGGLSPASTQKAFNVLSGVLALGVRERRLASSPADGVALPRVTTAERRYLTAAQVADLAFEATTGVAGRPGRPQNGVVVLTLSYAALRWGELVALRVRDIDLLKRRITVARSVTEVNGSQLVWGTPKSHESRRVPIAGFLVDILMPHLAGRDPDDLAFPAPGGGVLRNRAARRSWFDRAADQIGLDGLTPHELRHTAASLAISTGANIKVIQTMLGHKSAVVTWDRYGHLYPDDLDTLGDALDASYRESVERATASGRHLAAVRDLAAAR